MPDESCEILTNREVIASAKQPPRRFAGLPKTGCSKRGLAKLNPTASMRKSLPIRHEMKSREKKRLTALLG